MATLLVDGSNLWCRAYCTPTRMTPPGGALYIAAMMLNKLAERFGKGNLIICWDAGSGGRRALDPEYKAQRYPVVANLDGEQTSLPGSENLGIMGAWHNVRLIKALVNALGLMYSFTDGYEADDTIGSLAQTLQEKLSGKIYLHSHDKDFYQLATSNIGILHPEKKMRGKKYPEKLVHRNQVLFEYGVEPKKLPWFRAFTGDVSDNIPKIPLRVTKKFKTQLKGSIKQATCFAEVFEGDFDKKYREAMEEFKLRAFLNEQLLTINQSLTPYVQRHKVNKDFLNKLCKQFDIDEFKFKL